jgi:hypothetical protein
MRFAAKARREQVQLPLPADQVLLLVQVLSSGLQLQQYLDPSSVDEALYRNALRLVCGLPVTPKGGRPRSS